LIASSRLCEKPPILQQKREGFAVRDRPDSGAAKELRGHAVLV
jgi:hypothetical protein